MTTMRSNKPYLIRAFYEWIVDNRCTPIIAVNTLHPQCKIPRDYIQEEEIAFNISQEAIRDLKMRNDTIEFKATFSGIIHFIIFPVQAVLAIYAEENGEGMYFDEMEAEVNDQSFLTEVVTQPVPSGDVAAAPAVAKKAPFLKLVE